MEKIYGPAVATFFTAAILWTAFGLRIRAAAGILADSRTPRRTTATSSKRSAASIRRRRFPYVSLLVVGAASIVCSFFSLGLVIDALITTRILVQFIGQIGALTLLRRRGELRAGTYRMWLYPLPSLVALAGWIFVFATSDVQVILFGLVTLVIGVAGLRHLVLARTALAVFCLAAT